MNIAPDFIIAVARWILLYKNIITRANIITEQNIKVDAICKAL